MPAAAPQARSAAVNCAGTTTSTSTRAASRPAPFDQTTMTTARARRAAAPPTKSAEPRTSEESRASARYIAARPLATMGGPE